MGSVIVVTKQESYQDKACRLANAVLDAMESDTAHTVPGKRLITLRMNKLVAHVGSKDQASCFLDEIQVDYD